MTHMTVTSVTFSFKTPFSTPRQPASGGAAQEALSSPVPLTEGEGSGRRARQLQAHPACSCNQRVLSPEASSLLSLVSSFVKRVNNASLQVMRRVGFVVIRFEDLNKL